jgi:hypothetical protein
MKKPDWLTPPFLVAIAALFTGGLGGALFTAWWTNQPPLTIGYLVSSTSTGTDATAKTLVPNLSLRIGDSAIPAIHTHVISLSRTSGYADRAELAVTFNQDIQLFGNSFDAPSPVHAIACNTLPRGVKCVIGPMDGRGEYRVSLATDSSTPPSLAVAGRDVQLASLAEIASRDDSWWTLLAVFVGFTLALPISIIYNDYRRKGAAADLEKFISQVTAVTSAATGVTEQAKLVLAESRGLRQDVEHLLKDESKKP